MFIGRKMYIKQWVEISGMMFAEFGSEEVEDNCDYEQSLYHELIDLPFDQLNQFDWQVISFGEKKDELIEFILDLPFNEITTEHSKLIEELS